MDDFVSKPIDIKEFFLAIQRQLADTGSDGRKSAVSNMKTGS